MRHVEGVVTDRGCHRPCHSLAGNVGSAKHPRDQARETKASYGGSGSLPEAEVVEKRQPDSEMFLGTGEVAKIIARRHLQRMRGPETGRTAFAKGQLERLIGTRSGGREVARVKGGA